MKKLSMLLVMMFSIIFSVEAQTPVNDREALLQRLGLQEREPLSDVAPAPEPSQEYMSVTLTEVGTLRAALGEKLLTVDSLIVSGPLNAADFSAMSEAVYQGCLRVLDLENAEPEGAAIPDKAFCEPDPDFQNTKHLYRKRGLRKVILPKGITEIGRQAFAFEGNLNTVIFQPGLKNIREEAFIGCRFLMDRVELGDGLETIGRRVTHPVEGSLYIRAGRKFIYRQ